MKVAVVSSPFASHIGRMDFIFRAMRDNGHEVEFWGSGATKTIAQRNGFNFREMELRKDYLEIMQRRLKPHEFYTEVFFPMAKEQAATVVRLCEEAAPDVLESNTRVYSAAIASAITGIPVVNHNPNGFSFGQIPEDLYGFCAKGNESERQKAIMTNMSREFFATTDEWFNRNIAQPFGIGNIRNAIGFSSETHVVAHSIKELSKERIAGLEQVRLTGPIMSDSKTDIDFSRFRPYCYLSLGTCPWSINEVLERYRTLAAAIPREYRILIGLGELLSKAALGISDDRVVVYEKAPQIEALKHCEFVVCHGGSQTVHEALYYGKPVIGIPYHAELSEMVNSVERNKAGVRISAAQLNTNTIRDAVRQVTSEEVVGNAQRLAECFRHLDAQKDTLDLFSSVSKPRQ